MHIDEYILTNNFYPGRSDSRRLTRDREIATSVAHVLTKLDLEAFWAFVIAATDCDQMQVFFVPSSCRPYL